MRPVALRGARGFEPHPRRRWARRLITPALARVIYWGWDNGPPMSGSELVRGEPYRGLAYRVSIRRPSKLNAMTGRMWESLAAEVRQGCGSPLPAVVIEGTESAFSSGDDIEEMYRLDDPERSREFFGKVYSAFRSVLECRKPVVCVVRGFAAGGGAELLLACDVVIAEEGSWISFPEVALGLLPPLLVSLGQLAIGRRKAVYLATTGQRVSAEEAKALGIVDEVAPAGEIERYLDDLLVTVSSFPPQALASIKEASLRLLDDGAVRAAVDELSRLALTAEAKERMSMFLQRKFKPAAVARKPDCS